MNTAKNLYEATKGLLIAPAGYGKTHLIVEAIINHGIGVQLILTHTHAGVASIKNKIRNLNPSAKNIHIETIDGFILRYISSYPITSDWSGSLSNIEWSDVRNCGIKLFRKKFIKEIVNKTYSGLYVDEYQDCSLAQHAIILELTSAIPVRVLGDDLQGIFNFRNNQIVDWERDVKSSFDIVGELDTPWRWKNVNNSELGEWLFSVRKMITNNQCIPLLNLPSCVKVINPLSPSDKVKECFSVASKVGYNESIVIIVVPENINAMYRIASKLRGIYGVIEPIESKDLKKVIQQLSINCVYKKAITILEMAGLCFSGVSNTILKQEFEALKKQRLPNRRKPICITKPLKDFIEKNSLDKMIELFNCFISFPKSHLYRKELYYEVLHILKESHCSGIPLDEALIKVRENSRRFGRRMPKKSIARTVLIKGLEFDHIVILDAELFDRKNLYVALTRASKTVTIITKENELLVNSSA